jgi:heme-degrading monooxygenase HmoA
MSSEIGEKAYTSGDWRVTEGREEEFVQAWTEFTSWSHENASGSEEFILIRQARDPRHFLSFGAWDSLDSVDTWRSRPEFADLLGRCRALCDEFDSADYVLAARVG